MNDTNTAIALLRERAVALNRKKGWGVDGVRDPQSVAMAMSVEMGELMEHFLWLDADGVRALMGGGDETRRTALAEELADVLIYCLQLTGALRVDWTREIVRKLDIVCGRHGMTPMPDAGPRSDADTNVDFLRERAMALAKRMGWGVNGVQNPKNVVMAMSVEASEALEHFQWLDADGVRALMDGGDETRRADIAEELADVLIYGLQLSSALRIDWTREILRKLDIVDKRYPQ